MVFRPQGSREPVAHAWKCLPSYGQPQDWTSWSFLLGMEVCLRSSAWKVDSPQTFLGTAEDVQLRGGKPIKVTRDID